MKLVGTAKGLISDTKIYRGNFLDSTLNAIKKRYIGGELTVAYRNNKPFKAWDRSFNGKLKTFTPKNEIWYDETGKKTPFDGKKIFPWKAMLGI